MLLLSVNISLLSNNFTITTTSTATRLVALYPTKMGVPVVEKINALPIFVGIILTSITETSISD